MSLQVESPMTDLSPQAQAVLDAAYEVRPWMIRVDSGDIAAATLRAAVHQLNEKRWEKGVHWARMKLLAIADELEIG